MSLLVAIGVNGDGYREVSGICEGDASGAFRRRLDRNAVFERAGPAIGTRLSGPAIIDEMSATTLVPPGCVLRVDRSGNLLLENGA